MSGDKVDLTTWEGRIEWEKRRGLTADEIVDAFDHMYTQGGPVFTRGGEQLEWGMLHGRRRILPLIATITGTPIPSPAPAPAQRSGPEWRALVIKHRQTGEARPKLAAVALNMGWNSDQPFRDLTHRLGFERWYDVHAAVAAEPE